MQKIKLITDSASDIDIKVANENDILVLPFKVLFNDKEYKESYDFSKTEFYKMLEDFDGIPTHSQVTPYEWLQAIEKSVEEGYNQIVILPINQNGSSTFRSALSARMQFYNEHYDESQEKDVKIYVINTLTYTNGYGYPVLHGAQMIKENKTVGEVLDFFDDWFSRYELYFITFDLKYAKNSGRIGTAAAIAGELLGIKPVINLTDGKSVTFAKVRSISKAVDSMIDVAKANMQGEVRYTLVYGNDKDEFDSFEKLVKKELKTKPLNCATIGACVAINAGPKVLGLGFLGEKRNEQIIF